MVPVCKSFGSVRLQIERRSGLLSCRPLQYSHNYCSAEKRQNVPVRLVKVSNSIGLDNHTSASSSAGEMGVHTPVATVDVNIAKGLLDYINAAWTPYHAVGEKRDI